MPEREPDGRGHLVDSSDHAERIPPQLAALDAAMLATCEMSEWDGMSADQRALILAAALEAAVPVIAASARDRVARQMELLAANYPEEVFPVVGTSRDAIGGTAMRHAYRNAARAIREED